jgi:hypothetical protein
MLCDDHDIMVMSLHMYLQERTALPQGGVDLAYGMHK